MSGLSTFIRFADDFDSPLPKDIFNEKIRCSPISAEGFINMDRKSFPSREESRH